MPNGGTDNCMNCSHNKANSSLHDIKTGDRFTRIPFCMLRSVPVYDRAWTYCRNFTHHDTDLVDPVGPIFANGQWGRGYVRIPWYGLIEPNLHKISSCAVCGEESQSGISIALNDGKLVEFCTNDHYMDWLRDNPSEDETNPTLSAFVNALENGDKTTILDALQNIESLEVVDEYRRTAMHWAAFRGYTEAIDALAVSGAEINSVDRNRWTPLHYASFFGKDQAAALLLERGANPLERDRLGMRPIDLAGSEGYAAIVSALIEASYGSETEREAALLHAAGQGNLSLVEALVKADVDIECTDDAGWTPLLKAVYEGHVTVSVYLLDQGANVNAKNKYGYSPYSITHTWKTSGMEELKEIVLSRGAME